MNFDEKVYWFLLTAEKTEYRALACKPPRLPGIMNEVGYGDLSLQHLDRDVYIIAHYFIFPSSECTFRVYSRVGRVIEDARRHFSPAIIFPATPHDLSTFLPVPTD